MSIKRQLDTFLLYHWGDTTYVISQRHMKKYNKMVSDAEKAHFLYKKAVLVVDEGYVVKKLRPM